VGGILQPAVAYMSVPRLAWRFALLGSVGIARTASAGTSDGYDEIDPQKSVDVHAIVDLYAETNLSAPASRVTTDRAFDRPADAPSISVAELTLAHAPNPLGFRLDMGVGNVANAFLAYDPARMAHPSASRALSYIQQAFVTAVIPTSKELTVDIGKLATPVGLEDNVSQTSLCYSRGLLFTLAEPTYHTGARARVEPIPHVTLSAFWLNGWNTNLQSGNGMRTFGVSADVSVGQSLDVSVVYLAGPERAPTNLGDPGLSFRYELSGAASYVVTPRVSVAATADLAEDASDGGVSFWGVGGYVRTRILPWLAAVARAEHYADPEGFVTGQRQRIDEGTATLEATERLGPVRVTGRLEYRRDQSDVRVFDGLTHADTLSVSLVAGF
jgi:hypothetical protein